MKSKTTIKSFIKLIEHCNIAVLNRHKASEKFPRSDFFDFNFAAIRQIFFSLTQLLTVFIDCIIPDFIPIRIVFSSIGWVFNQLRWAVEHSLERRTLENYQLLQKSYTAEKVQKSHLNFALKLASTQTLKSFFSQKIQKDENLKYESALLEIFDWLNYFYDYVKRERVNFSDNWKTVHEIAVKFNCISIWTGLIHLILIKFYRGVFFWNSLQVFKMS